jgi:hypothetical protein
MRMKKQRNHKIRSKSGKKLSRDGKSLRGLSKKRANLPKNTPWYIAKRITVGIVLRFAIYHRGYHNLLLNVNGLG